MTDNRARAEWEVERELEGNRDLWEYAVSLKEREIERENAEKALRELLYEVLAAWRYEANQGDGIDERHAELFERAEREAKKGTT